VNCVLFPANNDVDVDVVASPISTDTMTEDVEVVESTDTMTDDKQKKQRNKQTILVVVRNHINDLVDIRKVQLKKRKKNTSYEFKKP
jgi:hypothetical protein